jgi:Xaa-Pro dipeptidase
LEPDVTDERTLRTAEAAAACGADWAILTAPDSVYYAAQVDTVIETGTSAFAGGPLIAIVGRDGTLGVVANNLDEPAAQASAADHVTIYRGLDLHDRTLVESRFHGAIDEALDALGVGGTVAVQAGSLPWTVAELLAGRGAGVVEIDAELTRQRMTKTAEEVERLRWCAHLTDLGQAACLAGARPGLTELELWAEVRLAMEAEEGTRLPVAGDLTSGIDNTARIGGFPTGRVIGERDPILCDLAPRARGYWGDSCNTIVIGEPPAGFDTLYRAAEAAVQTAVEQLRPGITMGELDTMLRDAVERHDAINLIHNGHGIGTGPHESPRVVPGEPTTIREGMMLMLEPGAYAPGVGGVRLEWMYLVTATGNEVLSGFPHVQSLEGAPATGAT